MEKLKQDIGLKFFDFDSEMGENRRKEISFFLSLPLNDDLYRSQSAPASYCA